MSRVPFGSRWLYLLLAVALAGYVNPFALPSAWAEDEQEEPAIDPPPPDEDPGPLTAAFQGRVPGDEAADQIISATDPATPIITKLGVPKEQTNSQWQVWRFQDYFILTPKADATTVSSKLLSIASAYQLTRPEKGEGPHVLVVKSLQPQPSAAWSIGWPAGAN